MSETKSAAASAKAGTKEASPKAVPPARKVQELNPTRMAECEFKRTLYVCTAHENTEPEDLLSPDYWTNVADKLRPWDKIEARADDGSWYAEFLVLETSRRWARVVMLNKHNLTTGDVSLTQAKLDEYSVEFKGPERKWSVIRRNDQEMLHEGEQTKASAFAWLSERIKAGL